MAFTSLGIPIGAVLFVPLTQFLIDEGRMADGMGCAGDHRGHGYRSAVRGLRPSPTGGYGSAAGRRPLTEWHARRGMTRAEVWTRRGKSHGRSARRFVLRRCGVSWWCSAPFRLRSAPSPCTGSRHFIYGPRSRPHADLVRHRFRCSVRRRVDLCIRECWFRRIPCTFFGRSSASRCWPRPALVTV